MARLEHHRHEALPDDVLDFLPGDDEANERVDHSEEELAVRSVPDSPLPSVDDPALREDSSEVNELTPASWFEDEEPEAPYATTEDEGQDAVDDLLIAQHYEFEEEPDEADTSDQDVEEDGDDDQF